MSTEDDHVKETIGISISKDSEFHIMVTCATCTFTERSTR